MVNLAAMELTQKIDESITIDIQDVKRFIKYCEDREALKIFKSYLKND